MFTGLIEEVGVVRELRPGAKSAAVSIAARQVTKELREGDSVAVNGVCLTVTAVAQDGFTADVMAQTVRATGLARLRPGRRVNLERALRLGDRLGGHMVSGHVDGTGRITRVEPEDNAVWFTVAADPELLRYIVPRGSVAVDGVSLTVAEVAGDGFRVSVIPHTRAVTILPDKRPGDGVNLECDVIGKYVEKLLGGLGPDGARGELSVDFLSAHGFV